MAPAFVYLLSKMVKHRHRNLLICQTYSSLSPFLCSASYWWSRSIVPPKMLTPFLAQCSVSMRILKKMACSHSLKFNGKLTVSFHGSLHHVGTWTSDNTQDSVFRMISKKLTKWITWSSGTTGERMHLYLYPLASEPLCATLCRHSIALWVIALLCLLHCDQRILSFEGIISKVMFQLYFRPAASGWCSVWWHQWVSDLWLPPHNLCYSMLFMKYYLRSFVKGSNTVNPCIVILAEVLWA